MPVFADLFSMGSESVPFQLIQYGKIVLCCSEMTVDKNCIYR